MGVIEFGQGRGFFAEMAACGLVGESAGRQDLYGDIALELLVAREVDHSHSARGYFLQDVIVAQSLANHEAGPALLYWRHLRSGRLASQRHATAKSGFRRKTYIGSETSRLCVTALRAGERHGDVLVNDDPALGAPFENHGPAAVEVRCGPFFVSDVRAESEGGPPKLAARMHAQVIVQFEFNARVWIKQALLRPFPILGPVVVLQWSKVEIGKVCIRRVIGLDLRKVERLPGRHNLRHQSAQVLPILLRA